MRINKQIKGSYIKMTIIDFELLLSLLNCHTIVFNSAFKGFQNYEIHSMHCLQFLNLVIFVLDKMAIRFAGFDGLGGIKSTW